MNQFCIPFLSELEIEYEVLCASKTELIQKTKEIISYLKAKYKILECWIENKIFNNNEDEINFFKVIKPKLLSKLMYHKKILKIETNLPPSKKDKRKYLEKKLDKTHKITKKNKGLYQYYKSKATYNDSNYFIRNTEESYIIDNEVLLNFNRKTSTHYDYIYAAFMTNEKIAEYLEVKMDDLENSATVTISNPQSELQWTGTNLDFIELIYGLHFNKVINSGNKEVKEITKALSKVFNMDIEEQVYRYFIDIKRRKINKTRFLTSMTENLNKVLETEQ